MESVTTDSISSMHTSNNNNSDTSLSTCDVLISNAKLKQKSPSTLITKGTEDDRRRMTEDDDVVANNGSRTPASDLGSNLSRMIKPTNIAQRQEMLKGKRFDNTNSMPQQSNKALPIVHDDSGVVSDAAPSSSHSMHSNVSSSAVGNRNCDEPNRQQLAEPQTSPSLVRML